MKRCKTCRQRIIKVNYAMGEIWMHQPEGADGLDGVYRYCHVTAAYPEENENDVTDG